MEALEKENLNIDQKVSRVSEKDMETIAKKIEAIVALGIIATIPVNTPLDVIALGEGGNLPKVEQSWFDDTADKVREIFGIEVDKGKSGGAGATGSFSKEDIEFGGGRSGGGGATGGF